MNLKSCFIYVLAAFVASSVFSSCASWSNAGKGAAIGAGTGGIIGGVASKKNPAAGAIIGAVVGGAAGAAIGAYMDKQAKDIEKSVKGAEVKRVGEGIDVTFDSGILFGFDSDALTGAARENVKELARILNQYPDTRITVQGHTDSKGTDNYNMALSGRRADAVRNYLISSGVTSNRINTEAYGETAPVATNETEEGRQKNRRVEVVIIANEELKRKAEDGNINN